MSKRICQVNLSRKKAKQIESNRIIEYNIRNICFTRRLSSSSYGIIELKVIQIHERLKRQFIISSRGKALLDFHHTIYIIFHRLIAHLLSIMAMSPRLESERKTEKRKEADE